MGVFRHEDRQTEPKDRDLSKTPRRDLTASTYDRIGSVTDGVGRTNLLQAVSL